MPLTRTGGGRATEMGCGGVGEEPSDRAPGPATSDEDLDLLFGIAGAAVRSGLAAVDVDRAITSASAEVERRRRRRLTVLRVAGTSVIVGVLLVWIVAFSEGGGDVVYTVVMFAVPATVVLRWYLESLDGGGLSPWRTPPTIEAWSREVTRHVVRLTEAIELIDQLSLVLEVHAGRRPAPVGDALVEVRGDLDRLRTRLAGCRAGAGGFIACCRTAPGKANWALLRQIDPDTVSALLRRCLGRVRTLAPDTDGAQDVHVVVLRTERVVVTLHRECADLVDAFDSLHRIATQETLQSATTLNVVRQATSSVAVIASGWGRSAVQRSAIRNVLLAEAPSGGPLWWPAVRRARAVGSAQVLALSGAL